MLPQNLTQDLNLKWLGWKGWQQSELSHQLLINDYIKISCPCSLTRHKGSILDSLNCLLGRNDIEYGPKFACHVTATWKLLEPRWARHNKCQILTILFESIFHSINQDLTRNLIDLCVILICTYYQTNTGSFIMTQCLVNVYDFLRNCQITFYSQILVIYS